MSSLLPELPLPLPTSSPSPRVAILSPAPQRASTASWASSLAAGLFPAGFPVLPVPPQVPRGIQPLSEAVHPAGCLLNTPQPISNNDAIINLAVFPAPSPSDPWHLAHARVCAHANQACAACSVAFICCSCRALRFTPGPPPAAPQGLSAPLPRRSRSSSPALFRNCGNGTPPPDFDDANCNHDDDAYMKALAEGDTCDNSSCPRGLNEPASYSLTVEQFDEGTEETYERIFRACTACNRSCRKSFMGHQIKSRIFDNSSREFLAKRGPNAKRTLESAKDMVKSVGLSSDVLFSSKASVSIPSAHRRTVPGSVSYALEHPINTATSPVASPPVAPAPKAIDDNSLHQDLPVLQDALRTLNARPPTPATFVATIRVKHDALCTHGVTSCPTCSCGLICCSFFFFFFA